MLSSYIKYTIIDHKHYAHRSNVIKIFQHFNCQCVLQQNCSLHFFLRSCLPEFQLCKELFEAGNKAQAYSEIWEAEGHTVQFILHLTSDILPFRLGFLLCWMHFSINSFPVGILVLYLWTVFLLQSIWDSVVVQNFITSSMNFSPPLPEVVYLLSFRYTPHITKLQSIMHVWFVYFLFPDVCNHCDITKNANKGNIFFVFSLQHY